MLISFKKLASVRSPVVRITKAPIINRNTSAKINTNKMSHEELITLLTIVNPVIINPKANKKTTD